MLLRRLRRPAGFLALVSAFLFLGEGVSAAVCAPPEPQRHGRTALHGSAQHGEGASVSASAGFGADTAVNPSDGAPSGIDCCGTPRRHDPGADEGAGCPFAPLASSGGCVSAAALEEPAEAADPPAASVPLVSLAESAADLLLGTSLFRPPRA